MELTIRQALEKAIDAHKLGNAQEADRLYTAILKAQPKHPEASHNLGILASSVGKMELALPLLKTALEQRPKVLTYWVSYIEALIKLDRFSDVGLILETSKQFGLHERLISLFDDKIKDRPVTISTPSSNAARKHKTKKVNPTDPNEALLQNLIDLLNKGHKKEALSEAKKLLSTHPKSALLLNILGVTYRSLDQVASSLEAFQEAVKLNPDFIDAYINIGNTYRELNQIDDAIAAYAKALELDPKFAAGHANMAMCYRFKGLCDDAIRSAKLATKIDPHYALAFNILGNALEDDSQLDEAIVAYKSALKINPKFAAASYNLGLAYLAIGEIEKSIAATKVAIDINKNYADAYNSLGIALQNKGKNSEAVEKFRTAININPLKCEYHRNLSQLITYTHDSDHFRQVKELYANANLTAQDRCFLSFTLAKIFEDIGDLKNSFEYLKVGNSERKALLNYDIKQDKSIFALLLKFSEDFRRTSIKAHKSEVAIRPIFIVGMPRSGTTLIEQIISSHSEVSGFGELPFLTKLGGELSIGKTKINAQAVQNIRKSYLSSVSKLSNYKHIFVDKMPHNFRFLPLIFSAFPEAKVIHVSRDPAATCWSNFKQFFTVNGLGYSSDLEDCVEFYLMYEKLMDQWNAHYPEKIYNLKYENLISQQEHETRSLIKFLNLDWQDSCLFPEKNKRSVRTASNQQVRKKIYKDSSETWRLYETFIGGVFDKLY